MNSVFTGAFFQKSNSFFVISVMFSFYAVECLLTLLASNNHAFE